VQGAAQPKPNVRKSLDTTLAWGAPLACDGPDSAIAPPRVVEVFAAQYPDRTRLSGPAQNRPKIEFF
jgi:hypothetical protein